MHIVQPLYLAKIKREWKRAQGTQDLYWFDSNESTSRL